MKIDGLAAITAILILSFAIDRVVTGLLFVLQFSKSWAKRFPEPAGLELGPDRVKAERKQQLAYFVAAALLAIPLIAWYGHVRLLAALGFHGANGPLDIIITGLALVGGSERIAALIQHVGGGGGGTAAPPAIEITGRLVLEEGASRDRPVPPQN